MGFVFMILGLLGIIPMIIALITQSGAIIILAVILLVVYWLLLGIISASLNGIFVAALYNYAQTGNSTFAFSPEIIQSAFKPKTK